MSGNGRFRLWISLITESTEKKVSETGRRLQSSSQHGKVKACKYLQSLYFALKIKRIWFAYKLFKIISSSSSTSFWRSIDLSSHSMMSADYFFKLLVLWVPWLIKADDEFENFLQIFCLQNQNKKTISLKSPRLKLTEHIKFKKSAVCYSYRSILFILEFLIK